MIDTVSDLRSDLRRRRYRLHDAEQFNNRSCQCQNTNWQAQSITSRQFGTLSDVDTLWRHSDLATTTDQQLTSSPQSAALLLLLNRLTWRSSAAAANSKTDRAAQRLISITSNIGLATLYSEAPYAPRNGGRSVSEEFSVKLQCCVWTAVRLMYGQPNSKNGNIHRLSGYYG